MSEWIKLCGVDEAGRGPLSGSVFAAAVILDPARPVAGLADSKTLSEARREALAPLIKANALAWCIAEATVEEIDRLNILQATMLAMRRAVAGLEVLPDEIEVDGNRLPGFELKVPSRAIVKGDAKVAAISAASILAKTARDAVCIAMDAEYPGYGFAQHKGYPTAEHLARLQQFGVTEHHRRSFRPVRVALGWE